MSILKKSSVLFIFCLIFSCNKCPECPSCDDEKINAKTRRDKSDADNLDSDAGVKPGATGKKPKVVTEFKLHARAGFHRVSIFEKPDMEGARLGYFFKGTRTMVGDAEYVTENCPKGWFALAEGGFVCQGRGMLVGAKPRYIPHPFPAPKTDQVEPYRHGFIREDFTPMYRRIPQEEEMWTPPVRILEEAVDGGEPVTEIIEHAAENDTDADDAIDGGVDYYEYTKKFKNVVKLLNRGFWVSVDQRKFDSDTHLYYYETVKGNFVPGSKVHIIRPPLFKGYEVLGDSPLPAAIVTSKHGAFFEKRQKKFRGVGPAQRLSSYQVLEISEGKSVKFYRIDEKRWIKSTQSELFELQKPPEGVGDDEKWITVDLGRQTLQAYEGVAPAFVTMISSGLPGSEETVTPTGKFNIRFKHLTDDMAGEVGDGDIYSVEDVPWVQYIHRNIAFHSAFWHSHYGHTRSHGCINLSPHDARWLFNWTSPIMPPGWHGVTSTNKNKGTVVIVQGVTPK